MGRKIGRKKKISKNKRTRKRKSRTRVRKTKKEARTGGVGRGVEEAERGCLATIINNTER